MQKVADADRVVRRSDCGARARYGDTNAKGTGSSGRGTVPPEALFPRMVKNTHTGRIAQRSGPTPKSEANRVTATLRSASTHLISEMEGN